MGAVGHGLPLPPSSSLPPLRSLISATATEKEVTSALQNLHALFCPLRLPISVHKPRKLSITAPAVDSGYVSQDDDDDNDEDLSSVDTEDAIASIRNDAFERDVAVRWLTSFITHAFSLLFTTEDSRDHALDDAAFILSSFSDSPADQAEEALTRDFSFRMPFPGELVKVQLNDAPLSVTDHTDVGLQSWGASIVLSEMMCAEPGRFMLTNVKASEHRRIVELGAGTGLVSLTLAKMVPRLGLDDTSIVATDYHPTVLENLRGNIATNFSSNVSPPLQVSLLDWSAPDLSAPLNVPAQMLVAADVVYAREHSVWLRDCAARLLAPNGVFWLMVTVREHGKFEGIAATVEEAFNETNGLCILTRERLEKRRGIGRGDEVCYYLYKIGWA